MAAVAAGVGAAPRPGTGTGARSVAAAGAAAVAGARTTAGQGEGVPRMIQGMGICSGRSQETEARVQKAEVRNRQNEKVLAATKTTDRGPWMSNSAAACYV